MDLIEILFIAFFILLPILEGVSKQRRKNRGQAPGPEEGPEPGRSGSREETEPRSAADMVPDDLWAVLTGETRRPQTGPEPESPWSSEPEPLPTASAESESAHDERSGAAPRTVREPEREPAASSSLEYRGPEAYSLEAPAPEPRSLEQPIPSARARHRAFHEGLAESSRRARRGARKEATPLVKALSSPEGLRQAVLVREILGPPKGLR